MAGLAGRGVQKIVAEIEPNHRMFGPHIVTVMGIGLRMAFCSGF